MAKYIHNISGSSTTIDGVQIADGAFHEIASSQLVEFQNSDQLLAELGAGTCKMSSDGVNDVDGGVAEQISFLRDEMVQEVTVKEEPPFSAKTVGGLKLYTRATGKTFAVTVGVNNLDFVIPFANMKFNGIEITNGKIGEKVNLKILDTATGTVKKVPNFLLNQFGYDVNLPDGMYVRESNYDADVFMGLQVRIEFTAIEARDVYVNYLIHELKA